MKNIDKDLQAQEDSGKDQIYDYLNAALKEEPEFRLQSSFVEKVMSRVSEQDKTAKRNYWFTVLGLVLVFLSLGYGTIIYLQTKGFIGDMGHTLWYAAIAAIVMLIFQYLDQTLVRPKALFTRV